MKLNINQFKTMGNIDWSIWNSAQFGCITVVRKILGRKILGHKVLGRKILGLKILHRSNLARRNLGCKILGCKILGLGHKILGLRSFWSQRINSIDDWNGNCVMCIVCRMFSKLPSSHHAICDRGTYNIQVGEEKDFEALIYLLISCTEVCCADVFATVSVIIVQRTYCVLHWVNKVMKLSAYY